MHAALDDILKIPGNRGVFEDLQRLLAEKKAIAFVGAGASAGMYPLWGEFIGKLADYAVEKSKAEPKDRDRWKAVSTLKGPPPARFPNSDSASCHNR